MYSKRISLLFFCFFALVITGNCQLGGSSTYNFMEIPVSARSSALGGNFVTVRDGDLSTATLNPSFLDSSVNKHIVLTYVPYFGGIDYGFVAYAQTFKNIGTFDASVKYINYGTFTQADVTGNITGTFWAGEYMFNIGYGRPVKDSTFSIGANLKMISSRLDQYYSWGLAADVAGSYVSPNHRFFAGLAIENVGKQMKDYYPGVSEPLPFDVNGGAALKLKHAPFRFSLDLQHLQKWDLTYLDPVDTETVNPLTGAKVSQSKLSGFADKLARHIVPAVEALFGKVFALRLAYNYEIRQELELTARKQLVGFSAGFGVKIYKFQLNYSIAEYHLGGTANTFTIGFNLGDFVSHRTAEEPPPPPPAPERPILPINN